MSGKDHSAQIVRFRRKGGSRLSDVLTRASSGADELSAPSADLRLYFKNLPARGARDIHAFETEVLDSFGIAMDLAGGGAVMVRRSPYPLYLAYDIPENQWPVLEALGRSARFGDLCTRYSVEEVFIRGVVYNFRFFRGGVPEPDKPKI